MKLRQLTYLVAIADNGLNISAAARNLYTSQSGISKQIKLLEQELGVDIFDRNGKSLSSITVAGQQVIIRARRIVREVEVVRALPQVLSGE